MVIFGLILLIAGALGIVAGIFGTEAESTSSQGRTDVHTTFLGIEMSASTLFIVAVASTLLVIAGLWFLKVGARQGWRRRKEQKKYSELNEKLERAEAERRQEESSDNER